MVNQEVFGGLVSALSRGEPLHGAMLSLFNAGYKKEDIEDAARLLQSQTPVQIAQKNVEMKKIEQSKKFAPKKIIKSPPLQDEKNSNLKVSPHKIPQTKQNVSKYSGKKSSGRFNRILDETIKNLQNLESPAEVIEPDTDFRPPIIIQRVSDYGHAPSKKTNKSAIVVLFVLLVLLLGSLVALFVFREKIMDFFNSFNF